MRERSSVTRFRFSFTALISGVLVFLSVANSQAQWVSQDIKLKPGWNAVYLSFQPAPADCESVFANVPVSSIAWWSRRVGDAEFKSDPTLPYPRSAHWRKWTADEPALSTFGGLLAGEAYLINLATNVNVSVRVKGTAVIVPINWLVDEFNLVGFPVASNKITFGSLFSFTDRIMINGLQEILPSGVPIDVFRSASTPIVPGQAYWVRCGPLATDFVGPIRLALGSASKQLDFGDTWYPQTLRMINETDAPRSVTIRHIASEMPPSALDVPAVAGKTPLLMEVAATFGSTSGSVYVPFPNTIVTNIPAKSELSIRLMPKISALVGGPAGATWQSVIRVSDEGNPGAAVVTHQVGVTCDTPDASTFDPEGLWVGNVSVVGVSRSPTQLGAGNVWDSTVPVAVTRPYTFPVLLHHGTSGTNREWRLMQRAYLATETNGTDLVFTDTVYAQEYANDHPACQITRLSSANLPLMRPLAMTSDGTNLSVTVTLAYDDPTNPFVHPFHPQHDNKEFRNNEAIKLSDGDESYSVVRTQNFSFLEIDPSNPGNPHWNISEAGGVFTEEVTGLNKTIFVQGVFRLERVSRATSLMYLDITQENEEEEEEE